MSTGGDGMHVEAKYQKGRDVDVRFGLWFAADRWPVVHDGDGALRRRAAICKCGIKLEGQLEGDYSGRLVAAEGPAIMAQLLLWRADYLKDGADLVAETRETRDEYFNTSDKVRNFILDECRLDPAAVELKQDIYNRYKGWHKETQASRSPVWGRNEFYRRLEEHELFQQHGCEFGKVRSAPWRTSDMRRCAGWR